MIKLLVLTYLALAFLFAPVRRAPALLLCRLGRALILWRVLHKPWRVAWQRAVREIVP